MKILVVAATAGEIERLAASPGSGRHHIDFLVTGAGMVPTAVKVSRALARASYSVALNFGVCGAFDRSIEIGSVVHVASDRLPELGAEDGDAFLTLDEIGLAGEQTFANPAPPASRTLAALPAVAGITVNTVHGSVHSIDAVVARFHPQVESMEGAAFMSACLANETPFAQVRAVSNVVERRNRASWKLADAVAALNRAAEAILDEL
jgi:futalosine hydrolase